MWDLSCNISGSARGDVFCHSLLLLHLDCRVEYAALATFGPGCRGSVNQKIKLFCSISLIFSCLLLFLVFSASLLLEVELRW